MVYHGSTKMETIWVSPENDLEDVCCIDLTKAYDENVFYVTTCSNTDWMWKFYMEGESNYEMVKHTIIDEIFEADSFIELLDNLDDVFGEIFGDIIAYEEEGHDECRCENCNHRGCLN